MREVLWIPLRQVQLHFPLPLPTWESEKIGAIVRGRFKLKTKDLHSHAQGWLYVEGRAIIGSP